MWESGHSPKAALPYFPQHGLTLERIRFLTESCQRQFGLEANRSNPHSRQDRLSSGSSFSSRSVRQVLCRARILAPLSRSGIQIRKVDWILEPWLSNITGWRNTFDIQARPCDGAKSLVEKVRECRWRNFQRESPSCSACRLGNSLITLHVSSFQVSYSQFCPPCHPFRKVARCPEASITPGLNDPRLDSPLPERLPAGGGFDVSGSQRFWPGYTTRADALGVGAPSWGRCVCPHHDDVGQEEQDTQLIA
jgi:hypothetical protein